MTKLTKEEFHNLKSFLNNDLNPAQVLELLENQSLNIQLPNVCRKVRFTYIPEFSFVNYFVKNSRIGSKLNQQNLQIFDELCPVIIYERAGLQSITRLSDLKKADEILQDLLLKLSPKEISWEDLEKMFT